MSDGDSWMRKSMPRDAGGSIEITEGTGPIRAMVSTGELLELYKVDKTFRVATPETIDPERTNPNAPFYSLNGSECRYLKCDCRSRTSAGRSDAKSLRSSPNEIPLVSFSIARADCHLKLLQYWAHFESEYDKGGSGISSWQPLPDK
jgi:hypothetical protein